MSDKTRIRDVCSRFSSGKAIPASKVYEEGMYPVYGGNGLRGYTDTFNFDGDCAVIGRQGAYCGNVKYFSGKGYMTEHAVVAVANQHNNSRFLAYKFALMDLGRYAGQSAQPGLSVETLLDVELDVPEKNVQDDIACVLSTIDEKIENNNAICSNLEAMAKLLYDYWFVQFDFPDENGKPYKSSGGKMVWNDELKREIPAGWEAGVLGDVIEKYTDGISSSNIGDLPYTPMDILPMRQMSFSETGSQEDANSSLIRYKKYSLLFGAMRPYFHRVCIAPFDGITRTTVFTLKERGNGELGYAFETLDQDYTVNYANAHHVGTQQPYAEWDGNMEKCTIPLPPAELRRKYSQMISDYIDVVIERNLENKQLASLRDFLLPMLMNGQVKVVMAGE